MPNMCVILYGNAAAQETARHLLEELEQVKRTDLLQSPARLRLILNAPIRETSLIPLLRQSGIQGYRLVE